MAQPKRPIQRYLPQFKAKVLKHILTQCNDPSSSGSAKAMKTTILAAAKKFSVHPTSVSAWIRENQREQELKQIQDSDNSTNTNTESCNSTQPNAQPTYIHLETFQTQVVNWLQKARTSLQTAVTESAGGGYLLKYGVSEISKEMNLYLKTAVEGSSGSEEEQRLVLYSWMAAWCKRLHESEYNDARDTGNQCVVDLVPASKFIKYTKPFKEEIVHFAQIIGQRRTARMFGVAQRRIFDWKSEFNPDSSESSEESSEDSPSNANSSEIIDNEQVLPLPVSNTVEDEVSIAKKQRLNSNSMALSGSETVIPTVAGSSNELKRKAVVQIANTAIDKEVFEWVQSRFPLKPSSTEIRDKARELYRAQGFEQIKCSYGWYRRWSERYNVSHGYHDESELDILEWILQEFDNNEILTYEKIQEFAQSAISKSKPSFKASANWVNRFLKRHYVIMNWEGHYKELLPPQLESKVQDFLQRLNSTPDDWDNICCMDEIPLYFSSSSLVAPLDSSSLNSPYDLEPCPTKLTKLSIKHCEATVILALLRDGTLMVPMIVVKCQSKANINQIYTKKDNPVIVFYSQSTEPSRVSLEKWFDMVWRKHVTSVSRIDLPARDYSNLLLWDGYEVHAELKSKCDQFSIRTETFPLGCACKLQPLNVFARRTFLKHIEEDWIKYMNQNMTSRDITWPSTNEIVDWVHKAYLSIRDCKEKMKKSFDTVGFQLT